MKYFSIAVLTLFILSFTNARRTHLDLIFEKGQIELNDLQKKQIKDFIKHLKNGDHLSIYPLTKDPYSDRYVYARIAEKQAASIQKYCTSIGLEYVGTPGNFPSSYRGMSVRVNLTYFASQKAPSSGLSDLFPKKPSQFFEIDPNKDTILVGEEGTVLYLEAGALRSDKPVQVELVEYYSLADYLKSGLHTSSNGQMIQTGGTIYLDAKEKESGKKVSVDKKKGIGVDFTLGKNDDDMQIFVKDPKSPNELNWVLPTVKVKKGKWQMVETTLDHNGNVVSEKVFNSREDWEAHLKAKKEAKERKIREQKEAEAKRKRVEKLKEANRKKMDSKLKIYDLGLINCDKFYDEEMKPFTFMGDQNKVAEYYLVFKGERGIMKARSENSMVRFGDVPINREATLLGFAFIGKKAYFTKKSIRTGSKNNFVIELKEVAEKYINEQLMKLEQQ